MASGVVARQAGQAGRWAVENALIGRAGAAEVAVAVVTARRVLAALVVAVEALVALAELMPVVIWMAMVAAEVATAMAGVHVALYRISVSQATRTAIMLSSPWVGLLPINSPHKELMA